MKKMLVEFMVLKICVIVVCIINGFWWERDFKMDFYFFLNKKKFMVKLCINVSISNLFLKIKFNMKFVLIKLFIELIILKII